jgi:hypothetical protein
MAATTRKDYTHDSNFDLQIKNGDFVVDYSDYNHIAVILTVNKGHIRNNTSLGVNIQAEQNGYSGQRVRRDIIDNLKKDGYSDVQIQFEGDQIKITI